MDVRTNLIEVLRARIEGLHEQLDLAHHDIDRLFAQDEAFRRRLLVLLDKGQIARARALIRWRLR